MAANSFSYLLVLITLSAVASSPVPAIFGFGDSTIDVGNNNYLTGNNVSKANYRPYGIDYPNSLPTGRFSNGYTIIDFIAQFLGFEKSPPAYLAQANNQYVELDGANFASAGSGILNFTRTTPSMSMQIQHFESHRAKMVAQIGEAETKRMLDYSLFVISTGSSDIFHFYKKKKMSFIKTVAAFYKIYVMKLYSLGARKFVIFDVGMLGCYPFSRSLYPNNGKCSDELNLLADSLNSAIRSIMSDLSRELEWMHFSIGGTYEFTSILERIRPLEVEYACCRKGKEMCSPGTAICEQRDTYMFWDMLHLTEKVAQMAGLLFFNGSYATTPINIKGLVQIY